MSGSLFIISAPSGAGKTSLVHALADLINVGQENEGVHAREVHEQILDWIAVE